MSTRALVLCAGKGTRLKPLTDLLPKPLLPVANRPVVFYALDRLRSVGITDIGVVVSPETIDPIRAAVGDGSKWGASVHYIVQPRPGGLAHAVQVSQSFLGGDSFVLFLGDVVMGQSIEDLVGGFHDQLPAASVTLKQVTNPRAFGVATLDHTDRIVDFVEKPDSPASDLVAAGVYMFNSEIHEAIANITPSPRGELEITDAIQWLVGKGKLVLGHRLDDWWSDVGTVQDLLTANRRMLESRQEGHMCGRVDGSNRIRGVIDIGSGAVIENSSIEGPVSIAENCIVLNSVVGPFVSIGTGTTITDAQLQDSIVLPRLRIDGAKALEGAVVGSDIVTTTERQGAFR